MVDVPNSNLSLCVTLAAVTAFSACLGSAACAQSGKPAKAATAPPSPAAAGPAVAEAGLWIDHTGKGAVEISPCGNKLCGTIVWLDQPLDGKGNPIVDDNNPETSKRTQPVCGLQVIGNLVQQKDGSWDKGWIYDPENGETYDLAVSIKPPNRLSVTGYLGLKLLGETYTWSRPPAEPALARCGPVQPPTR